MVIIETSIFTRQIEKVLDDEEYRALQTLLISRPDAGKVIVGSGGIRKARWAASGRGKRGSARVIYYWAVRRDHILMLLIYQKNEQDDLTPAQLQRLRQIVEKEYR